MQFADKNSKSRRVGLYGQSFLYTLCISKMGSKNSLEKFWLIVWKHISLQPIIGWPIVPVGAGQANCSLVGREHPFGMSRKANTLEANSWETWKQKLSDASNVVSVGTEPRNEKTDLPPVFSHSRLLDWQEYFLALVFKSSEDAPKQRVK